MYVVFIYQYLVYKKGIVLFTKKGLVLSIFLAPQFENPARLLREHCLAFTALWSSTGHTLCATPCPWPLRAPRKGCAPAPSSPPINDSQVTCVQMSTTCCEVSASRAKGPCPTPSLPLGATDFLPFLTDWLGSATWLYLTVTDSSSDQAPLSML